MSKKGEIALTKSGRPKAPGTPPWRPSKPHKPSPTRSERIELIRPPHYDSDYETSLQGIIESIPPNIPYSEIKITASADMDSYEHFSELSFAVWYTKETENENFGKQMGEYQERLAEYEKALKTWKVKNEAHLLQKKAYEKWRAEEKVQSLDKEIKRLQSERNKLSKDKKDARHKKSGN